MVVLVVFSSYFTNSHLLHQLGGVLSNLRNVRSLAHERSGDVVNVVLDAPAALRRRNVIGNKSREWGGV